ncbi:patatin-like phospholipase family protein [Clostridium sp.]|uniref:patatin-like phospholipase family protein n=1 Tax=Clostridium sp. TaxID=1506 RepID=UPI002FC99301
MKIGLVLSGGGGKGAYELGVWKALKDLELDKYIDVFAGTSIGAFNAILFAQDDMVAAEKLWDEVTMDKLVPISKFELIKRGLELAIGGRHLNLAKKYMLQKLEEGGVPKDGAREIIETYLDVNKVKEREKICYAACTEIPSLNAKYFRINDYDDMVAKEMIVASASLPMIYDCTEVLGERYIDGGVADNTPIQPVYGENCDIIIVVLLSKDETVDKSLYPNTKILELAPKKLNESTLKGTLNLDTESKRVRIKEGYDDTMGLLEPIMIMTRLKHEREEHEKYPKLYKFYNWIKKIV